MANGDKKDGNNQEAQVTRSELQKAVSEAAAAAATETVKALSPTMVALAQVSKGPQQLPRGTFKEPPADCGVCRQKVTACAPRPIMGEVELEVDGKRVKKVQQLKDKDGNLLFTPSHAKVVVFPERYPDAEFSSYFQGVRINGILYMSQRPDHAIDVPHCAVGDIKGMVQKWEDDEVALRIPRKKKHNSGGVGEGRPNPVNPAAGGFR